MRPLLVRGAGARMIIDAGAGDKMDPKAADIYAFDRASDLDATLREAGWRGRTSTWCSRPTCTSITRAVSPTRHVGRVRAALPERALRDQPRRVGRCDASARTQSRQLLRREFRSVARRPASSIFVRRQRDDHAGRAGAAHRRPHALPSDRRYRIGGQHGGVRRGPDPTRAHVDVPWIMGYDLYPMETLEFKRAFVREAIEHEYLIFFEHDPASRGRIHPREGRPEVRASRRCVERRGRTTTCDGSRVTDRHHRRQRPVRHGGADRPRGAELTTPFGDPSGPYVVGTLRGKRVAFLARHGAGHRLMPGELNYRANIFGMKMLGVEYILSASAVGACRSDTCRSTSWFPTSSSIAQGRAQHVLRRRPRRARRVRASGLPAGSAAVAYDSLPRGRRHRAQGRHIRVHGRPAVLDAGRIEAVSIVGHGHHRHDEPAGSQARARGGDLLRDDRARDRLRLLAPRPRFGDRRHDHREPGREREDRAAGHRRRRARGCRTSAPASARRALAHAIITRPDAIPADVKRDLAPIIGRYHLKYASRRCE